MSRYDKVNWSAIWFVFFSVCSMAFGGLLVLKITREISVSWFVVFLPLVIEMFFPVLIVIVAMIVEAIERRKMNGEH